MPPHLHTGYLLRVGYSTISRGCKVEQDEHCSYSHRAYSLAEAEIKIIFEAESKDKLEKSSLRKFLWDRDQKGGENKLHNRMRS